MSIIWGLIFRFKYFQCGIISNFEVDCIRFGKKFNFYLGFNVFISDSFTIIRNQTQTRLDPLKVGLLLLVRRLFSKIGEYPRISCVPNFPGDQRRQRFLLLKDGGGSGVVCQFLFL